MAKKKRDKKGETSEGVDSSGLTREEREEKEMGQESYSPDDNVNWRAADDKQH